MIRWLNTTLTKHAIQLHSLTFSSSACEWNHYLTVSCLCYNCTVWYMLPYMACCYWVTTHHWFISSNSKGEIKKWISKNPKYRIEKLRHILPIKTLILDDSLYFLPKQLLFNYNIQYEKVMNDKWEKGLIFAVAVKFIKDKVRILNKFMTYCCMTIKI